MDEFVSHELRLPLDSLLINDVETLEVALHCKYAVEFECEIYFCKNKEELDEYLNNFNNEAKWYEIDIIENERIQAVIDLLNKAEKDNILGHIIDKIVR